MEMPGEVMQALAARKSTRDHRHEGFDRRERVGDRRLLAEQHRIDFDQELRNLIGGPPQHDAVDMRKMRLRRLEIGDAAVEDDRPVGMGALQRMDQRIVERRDGPVVFGAQSVEPRLARMDDDAAAPAASPLRRSAESLLGLLLVDADPAFDGDRNADRGGHRGDAVGHKLGLAHETRAEAAALHPVGRAAAIEIDFVIAEVRPDPRRFGEPRGSAPPSWSATGCSSAAKPIRRSRGPNTTASAVTISV